jgi:hypothetical protein
MALSTQFWRWLSCVLTICLALALVRLHLLSGYPQTWNNAQPGMTISQVRASCGPPDYSSGMKPDRWEKPFLWGAWVLEVGHDEFTQGPQAIVSNTSVYFDHHVFGWVTPHHRCWPAPTTDREAWYKAFGQELKPTPPEQPARVNLP